MRRVSHSFGVSFSRDTKRSPDVLSQGNQAAWSSGSVSDFSQIHPSPAYPLGKEDRRPTEAPPDLPDAPPCLAAQGGRRPDRGSGRKSRHIALRPPAQAVEEAQIGVDVGDHGARSGAGGGVDVAHALREMILTPRTAPIHATQDLAAAGHAVHLLGIARVEGPRPHGAVRL